MSKTQPHVVEIRSFPDDRGKLGVIEFDELPFVFKRMYYLHDVPEGAVRGEHGHKLLEQFIVCMYGAFEVTLDDGNQEYNFRLDRPNLGLYVPPGMWRSLKFVEKGSVCCVLASRVFEAEDYIYDLDTFRQWARQQTDAQLNKEQV